MDEKGRELCPRLVDYLVIVGRRFRAGDVSLNIPGGSSSSFTVSSPELLRRYPIDDHRDFQLPKDVTVFCQPEGCITKTVPRRTQSFRDSSTFVFTLTEKDSAKIRYGVCLNFYQAFERRSASSCDDTSSVPQATKINKRRDKKVSLTSLCLISHHPFLSAYRNLLSLLKRLVDGCCRRIATNSDINGDVVWSVLTGRWTDAIPSEVMNEIRELETWILMLLSAPVPVPGKTTVRLEVMPTNIIPVLEFALPDHTRFSLVDFPLHLPIELLGIDTVVEVLTALMLEYKVVIQSRDYNAVSMSVLALVALLYPLEYMFPVIPLLPTYMPSAEQLLFAPTPFVIGVPASFFAQKEINRITNEIIVVDLDTNQVLVPEGMSIPDLPEPDCTNLKAEFQAALSKTPHISSDPYDSETGEEREASSIVESDIIDVAARVAMIRFFNSANVFANFSEHTRTLRLYPRPVVAFQTESFLRSRPQLTQFIVDLCKTQAVEYFAECSLCPRNETYVRVQTGIDNPMQIGDKARWFAANLMPVHFTVYTSESKLAEAWQLISNGYSSSSTDSDVDGDNDSDHVHTDGDSYSSIDDLVFESLDNDYDMACSASKPIGEVNDVYHEPLTLRVPPSESALSLGSSLSSERSSPSSSISTSAMDSEADFARLAENLALKSDAKGDFSFDHSDDSTPVEMRRGIIIHSNKTQQTSASTTPTVRTPPLKAVGIKSLVHITDSGKEVLGPQLFSAINGYAEKSHDMFNQMLNRTAPKAQAFRDKTVRPIAVAAANRMEQSHYLMKSKTSSMGSSVNTASQQSKNQQVIRDICDQVLSGQGVGVFTYPKLRRLVDDESLRELICSKLNLGLEIKHTEDEFVQDMQLTRAQYKGYIKVLQLCVSGLENSYNTPGSNGLASMFHVLEIAHTHYWAKETEAITPASGNTSLLGTPSTSMHDFQPLRQQCLPSSQSDIRNISPQITSGHSDSFPQSVPPPPPRPSLCETSNARSGNTSSVFRRTDVKEPDDSALPSEIVPVAQMSSTVEPPVPAASPAPPPFPPPPAFPPPSRPPPPLPPRPVLHLKSERSSESSETITAASEASSSRENNSLCHVTPNARTASDVRQTESEEKSDKCTNRSQPSTALSSPLPPRSLPIANSVSSSSEDNFDRIRHYVYQDLILSSQNPLWQKMAFWENTFFDIVAQERDIIGMDQEPCEMIDRYSSLSDSEKKRLELDEDRLLATLLHNLTAYMVMCGTGQKAIQQKIRRLLGKAHIGLMYSKTINQLLDNLPQTQGNGVPLKPLGSRLMQKHSFTVHAGSSVDDTLMFMEVCDDAVVLRSITGAITDRWWYERLVNMTYSPKTRVLCLWRRHEDKVHMHKFYTKKCRELYSCMKSAMERAATRGKVAVTGRDLGGEFPVHDTESNQGGLLQVRIDGVALLFANRQHFIELSSIKKCNTIGGNVFILEEYDRRKGELVQRRYMSQMADQICYAVLCVFSFVAAGRNHTDSNKSTTASGIPSSDVSRQMKQIK